MEVEDQNDLTIWTTGSSMIFALYICSAESCTYTLHVIIRSDGEIVSSQQKEADLEKEASF